MTRKLLLVAEHKANLKLCSCNIASTCAALGRGRTENSQCRRLGVRLGSEDTVQILEGSSISTTTGSTGIIGISSASGIGTKCRSIDQPIAFPCFERPRPQLLKTERPRPQLLKTPWKILLRASTGLGHTTTSDK